MRPSRLPSLLLAALVFLHGLALGAAPVHGLQPAPAAGAAAVNGRQQSVPIPQHDETTCPFCHAAVTLPCLTVARTVIPDAPAAGRRGVPAPDDRLPRSAAERPASSRAPPALRFV